jgi:fermentation-respiration switch protein FrsA (DUF1100 family)
MHASVHDPLWRSQELYAKAKGDKELFVIDGATHMDLYAGETTSARLCRSWLGSTSRSCRASRSPEGEAT